MVVIRLQSYTATAETISVWWNIPPESWSSIKSWVWQWKAPQIQSLSEIKPRPIQLGSMQESEKTKVSQKYFCKGGA